ncbi:PH domain-containing protein [Tissierella sp. Yu-01]|uniref:PH domain-containing protein n=1 Tax=Tissierella sp. Yu-01 TaxID=3035694 RepID=UPI00240D0550|nr:PH domain-containing protein [Tissierella sp. Yu-01]WFA10331.1 PH domain-containing protein [Tissierella sp. Yu-01]
MEDKILEKHIFKLSWLSLIPHILAIALYVGIFTTPIKILRILTTKIIVDPNMVYGEKGILRKDIQNSPMKHVQSVRVDRSLFGRIFGYGDVIITTAGAGYIYKGIGHPEKLREIIISYM